MYPHQFHILKTCHFSQWPKNLPKYCFFCKKNCQIFKNSLISSHCCVQYSKALYDHNLRLQSRTDYNFSHITNSRVVICNRKMFITLATDLVPLLLETHLMPGVFTLGVCRVVILSRQLRADPFVRRHCGRLQL